MMPMGRDATKIEATITRLQKPRDQLYNRPAGVTDSIALVPLNVQKDAYKKSVKLCGHVGLSSRIHIITALKAKRPTTESHSQVKSEWPEKRPVAFGCRMSSWCKQDPAIINVRGSVHDVELVSA